MRKLRILLVEDEATSHNNFVDLLTGGDHEVVDVWNGKEAAEALEKQGQFDAVITDVRMPGGDGYILLQWMHRMDITPPTYVHSSDLAFWGADGRINLPDAIQKYFTFAEFHRKGTGSVEEIEAFVAQVAED